MFPLESNKPTGTGEIRLTRYSHGSGCGCKVAPSVLDEILKSDIPAVKNAALLVGNDTKDDAAVYDMGNGTGLVSTTDFFTPIVDDAFDYGRIAAANSLSDVYAMGGKPFMAIAILGWPVEKLPPSLAQRVIAGAKDICAQAGVSLAGGHTIDAPEPFFGLAVSGTVFIPDIKRNAGAKEGDILYLTKPLGTGILTTALKRDLITAGDLKTCISSMAMLNSIGAELGHMKNVHALTDVTGFGLIGHLLEMCEGSGLSAELAYDTIPLMDHVKDLTAKYIYADNTMRNWKSYEAKVEGVTGESLLTLCDPQTNGGLLISVSPTGEKDLINLLQSTNTLVAKIGVMTARKTRSIYII